MTSETYRPLSVVLGTDADVLPILFDVHAPYDPFIVDCTFNTGKMWKNIKQHPDRKFDIDPIDPECEQADCANLPLADRSVDVLVFDPPHLPNAIGTAGSSGIEASQYGLTGDGDLRSGDNVTAMFPPFLAEAKRVLRPNGVVFAKLSDFVHNHRYQWQHLAFIADVRTAGLTPCDLIVKVDPAAGNLKSSKWQNVKHVRRGHGFWIVARNGRCERSS